MSMKKKTNNSSLGWLMMLAMMHSAAAAAAALDCFVSLEKTPSSPPLLRKVHLGLPEACDSADNDDETVLRVHLPDETTLTLVRKTSVKYHDGTVVWTSSVDDNDDNDDIIMSHFEYLRLPDNHILGSLLLVDNDDVEWIYDIHIDEGEQVATVSRNVNIQSTWRDQAAVYLQEHSTTFQSQAQPTSKSLRGSAHVDTTELEQEEKLSSSSYFLPKEYELQVMEDHFQQHAPTTNSSLTDAHKSALQDTISQVQLHQTMERIVGGSNAAANQFPYYVSVGGCGGTLIGERTVLTVAHCFKNHPPSHYVGFKAYINAPTPNTGIERTVSKVVLHPSYTAEGNMWDFCLVKLDQTVDPYNGLSNPPSLALNTNDNFPSTKGDSLTVIGHGVEETGGTGLNDVTKYVNKPYVTDADCADDFWFFDSGNMLCAGGNNGEGACRGDSGGPMVKEQGNTHTLVGVTSWGSASGCALDGIPNGFSKVSAAVPWIIAEACPWENNGMDVCSESTPSAPDNNSCGSATDLQGLDGNTVTTSSGSTFWASQENVQGCGGSNDGYTVWYKFQALHEYEVTASLCGSEYDTFVAVYEGNDCQSLSCQAYNDDHPCPSPRGGSIQHQTKSRTTFRASAMSTYYVAVSGADDHKRGNYQLAISTGQPIPQNDDCVEAQDLPSIGSGFSQNVQGFTAGGSTEDKDLALCGIASGDVGVWYKFTATADTTLTATTCDSAEITNYDTKIALFRGSSCNSLTCEAFHDDIGNADRDCRAQSTIEATLQKDQQYYIHVSGFSHNQWADTGSFGLDLSTTPELAPRIVTFTTEQTTGAQVS